MDKSSNFIYVGQNKEQAIQAQLSWQGMREYLNKLLDESEDLAEAEAKLDAHYKLSKKAKESCLPNAN